MKSIIKFPFSVNILTKFLSSPYKDLPKTLTSSSASPPPFVFTLNVAPLLAGTRFNPLPLAVAFEPSTTLVKNGLPVRNKLQLSQRIQKEIIKQMCTNVYLKKQKYIVENCRWNATKTQCRSRRLLILSLRSRYPMSDSCKLNEFYHALMS